MMLKAIDDAGGSYKGTVCKMCTTNIRQTPDNPGWAFPSLNKTTSTDELCCL